MYASESGHLEVVKYLVENGAEINILGAFENNDVPLLLASYNGHLEVVKYLVENGADINITSEYWSNTALIIASYNGHLEIVKYLIENTSVSKADADLNIENADGYTALMYASDNEHLEIVEYLLENGANGYPKENIIDYAMVGDLANVQKSIENGEDINMTDRPTINSALDYASMHGYTEIVKYLVENGADINSKSGYGTTPLMYASQYGHLEVVKRLVEQGADPDKCDSSGRGETALIIALENGHLEVVKYLADKSDINIKDYDGKAALDYAKSTEIVEYLESIRKNKK